MENKYMRIIKSKRRRKTKTAGGGKREKRSF
jgi:hypothetical protein